MCFSWSDVDHRCMQVCICVASSLIAQSSRLSHVTWIYIFFFGREIVTCLHCNFMSTSGYWLTETVAMRGWEICALYKHGLAYILHNMNSVNLFILSHKHGVVRLIIARLSMVMVHLLTFRVCITQSVPCGGLLIFCNIRKRNFLFFSLSILIFFFYFSYSIFQLIQEHFFSISRTDHATRYW